MHLVYIVEDDENIREIENPNIFFKKDLQIATFSYIMGNCHVVPGKTG